jgi:hypothetical protein
MDTTAIFAAAAHSAHWTITNLGPHTEVSRDGYMWTVKLPAKGEAGTARITARYGYGGVEHLDLPATPAQTIPIVEAVMAALRSTTPAEQWEVEHKGTVVATCVGRVEAEECGRKMIAAGHRHPDRIRVRWECTQCPEYDYCEDCENGRDTVRVAHVSDGFSWREVDCYISPADA